MYRANRTKKSTYRSERDWIVLNFIPISHGSTKQSESTRLSFDPGGIAAKSSNTRSLQSPGTKVTSAFSAICLTRLFRDSRARESFSQKMYLSKGVAGITRAAENQLQSLRSGGSYCNRRRRITLYRFACPTYPSSLMRTTGRNTTPNCASSRPMARLPGKKGRRPQQPSDHPG